VQQNTDDFKYDSDDDVHEIVSRRLIRS